MSSNGFWWRCRFCLRGILRSMPICFPNICETKTKSIILHLSSRLSLYLGSSGCAISLCIVCLFDLPLGIMYHSTFMRLSSISGHHIFGPTWSGMHLLQQSMTSSWLCFNELTFMWLDDVVGSVLGLSETKGGYLCMFITIHLNSKWLTL